MSNSVIKKIVASTIEQDLSSNTNIYLDSSVLGIAVFATEDGSVRVEARIQDGSVWLSQELMAQLYSVTVSNITQHIGAIFRDGELNPNSVVKEYLITVSDGKKLQK